MQNDEQITFEEEEIVEIDFSDYGFMLQTPVSRCHWTTHPLDEDEAAPVIYDPDMGLTLDEPLTYMGIQFDKARLNLYEELRLAAASDPRPPVLR